MALDREYEQLAKSLPLFELTADPREPVAGVRGPAPADIYGDDRFLDFYSKDGLRRALHHYGLDARLAELGLGDVELELDRADPFRHRLEAFVGPGRDDRDRIMDLRIHLTRVSLADAPGAGPLLGGDERTEFDVMAIEWLTMQNPRGQFSKALPRLPGQRFPGTQLGRAMHNLLMIMAARIGRDALLATPERWHLARLYHRGGYRFSDEARNEEVEEIAVLTRRLPFAVTAWAVERGFVRRKEGAVYRYQPAPMLLPLSPALKLRLLLGIQAVREVLQAALPTSYEVDLAGLRASLRSDPVPGIDPEQIPDAVSS